MLLVLFISSSGDDAVVVGLQRREHNDANDSGSRRRQRPTFRSSNVSLSAKATAAQTSQTNLAKTLGKSTYFSDANPRNMRRLMNIIAVTGTKSTNTLSHNCESDENLVKIKLEIIYENFARI